MTIKRWNQKGGILMIPGSRRMARTADSIGKAYAFHLPPKRELPRTFNRLPEIRIATHPSLKPDRLKSVLPENITEVALRRTFGGRLYPVLILTALTILADCKRDENPPSGDVVFPAPVAANIPPEPVLLDATGRRFAVIINGDAEPQSAQVHNENTQNSANFLSARGFSSIYLLSATQIANPGNGNISLKEISKEGLSQVFDELRKTMGVSDELFVYVTGHGDFNRGTNEASIVLRGEEVSSGEFGELLGRLPDCKQTIIMDQCFGGTFAKELLRDNRLVIANTAEEDLSRCQIFARAFWGNQIIDINGDSQSNIYERFEAGIKAQEAELGYYGFIFSLGGRYRDQGFGEAGVKPPYPTELIEVNDPINFEKLLKKYDMGITAVDFYAEWCGPCKDFAPQFENLARIYSGRIQFVRVNIDKAQGLLVKYNVDKFPTVLIFQGELLVGEFVGAEVSTVGEKIVSVLQDANLNNTFEQIDKNLASPSKVVRIRALMALRGKEDQARLIDYGVKYINDTEGEVRAEAAHLLRDLDYSKVTFEQKYKVLQAALATPGLSDPSGQVREYLAQTLGNLELQDGRFPTADKIRVIEKIFSLLPDEDAEVPLILAQAFEQLLSSENLDEGYKIQTADRLIKCLGGPDKRIRRGAAYVSYYIPASDIPCQAKNSLAQKFVQLLNAEADRGIKMGLFDVLNNFAYSNIKPGIKINIVKTLLRQLDERDSAIRRAACFGLCKYADSNVPGKTKIKMIKKLGEKLRIRGDAVRYFYLVVLAELASSGEFYDEMAEVMGPVLKLAADEDEDLREVASTVLTFVVPNAPAADKLYEKYSKYLNDVYPDSQARAVTIIGNLMRVASPETKIFICLDLARMIDNRNSIVRIATVKALAKVVQSGLNDDKINWVVPWAVEQLENKLADRNNGVRSVAIMVLGELAGSNLGSAQKEDIVLKLIPFLQDDDCGVRRDTTLVLQSFYMTDISPEVKQRIEESGVMAYQL